MAAGGAANKLHIAALCGGLSRTVSLEWLFSVD